MKKKAWMSWSSGKDSAWALHEVLQGSEFEVTALLTTVNTTHERVAMHAVRTALLKAQAEAVGLPLVQVDLPWPCPNGVYEERMRQAVERARSEGVTHMIFGDLFLEDIRAYREEKLAGTGISPVFPLWQRPTRELAQQMLQGGLRAQLTAVDPKRLSPDFVGRSFDAQLLQELPEAVDPCGENGEFHTFVHAGPMYRHPVPVTQGERVERDGFWFADLLPAFAESPGHPSASTEVESPWPPS